MWLTLPLRVIRAFVALCRSVVVFKDVEPLGARRPATLPCLGRTVYAFSRLIGKRAASYTAGRHLNPHSLR